MQHNTLYINLFVITIIYSLLIIFTLFFYAYINLLLNKVPTY